MTENIPVFKIGLTEEAIDHLQKLSKWASFFSILRFICLALIILLGFISVFVFIVTNPFGRESEMGGALSPLIAAMIFLLIAIVCFLPTLYLYKFSLYAKRSIQTSGTPELIVALIRAVQSLRPCRASRGSPGDPRRRGLLPGGAGSPGKTGARGGAAGGGAGPRHPADHLAGHSARRCGRPLRRRRLEEAGHLHPLRRVPGRGPGHAAEEPGRGAPPQAPGGRDQGAPSQERGPGALVCRDAGAGHPLLPEPGGGGGAGHRRAHRPGPEMREADRRGEQLGLSEEELAFYDALETNDSAVQVLGEPTLKQIARELVETVRRNVTIDWAERENVRAQLRRLVRRVLRKHSYPPDKQEKATQTVLEQMEVLSERWASGI
jgi:hypothetical protein